MKPTILILLLSVATISVAQNGGTISSTEKKQLENKFKALSNFYIDDTGLVVYRDQSAQPTKPSQPSNQSITVHNNDVRVVSERTEPSMLKKEPVAPVRPVVINERNIAPPIQRYEGSASGNNIPITISKQPISTSTRQIVAVEDKKINSAKDINSVVKTNKVVIAEKVTTEVGNQEKKVRPQGSIFDRRRKSEYKNMEEAALAVEALLEELKKEQVSLKGSGSMSSRLAKGVTKDLRKRESSITTPYQSAKDEVLGNAFEDDQPSVTEYGTEPTYFINGVRAEKAQINKLMKDDIINREIRVKNTITDNPNGEIWYTVKETAVY